MYFDAFVSHMIAMTKLDDFVVEIKKDTTSVTSNNPRLTIDL